MIKTRSEIELLRIHTCTTISIGSAGLRWLAVFVSRRKLGSGAHDNRTGWAVWGAGPGVLCCAEPLTSILRNDRLLVSLQCAPYCIGTEYSVNWSSFRIREDPHASPVRPGAGKREGSGCRGFELHDPKRYKWIK